MYEKTPICRKKQEIKKNLTLFSFNPQKQQHTETRRVTLIASNKKRIFPTNNSLKEGKLRKISFITCPCGMLRFRRCVARSRRSRSGSDPSRSHDRTYTNQKHYKNALDKQLKVFSNFFAPPPPRKTDFRN